MTPAAASIIEPLEPTTAASLVLLAGGGAVTEGKEEVLETEVVPVTTPPVEEETGTGTEEETGPEEDTGPETVAGGVGTGTLLEDPVKVGVIPRQQSPLVMETQIGWPSSRFLQSGLNKSFHLSKLSKVVPHRAAKAAQPSPGTNFNGNKIKIYKKQEGQKEGREADVGQYPSRKVGTFC